MLLATLLIAALLQQPAEPPKLDVPILKAGLGKCSADFTVSDVAGKPVYLAVVHVKIRYGAMSMKRMDLEVSTNAEGKARVEGLPEKARPMVYDVQKDNKKIITQQDVAKECHKTLNVTFR